MSRPCARIRAWTCVLLLAAPSSLTGCPGHIDDQAPYLAALEGDAGAPSCGDVPMRILLPTCGPQGCHGGPNPASKLDLASPNVASRLVGIPGSTCGGVLADPKNPKNSVLYQKIAIPIPTCGGRMPLGVDPLDAETIACIEAWLGSL